MCSLTAGGPEAAYSESGIYPSIEQILLPVHRGIFAFTGFTVIAPFVVYAPNRITPNERLAYLERYRYRLLNLDSAPTIAPPKTEDYDGFVRRSRR